MNRSSFSEELPGPLIWPKINPKPVAYLIQSNLALLTLFGEHDTMISLNFQAVFKWDSAGL